MNDENCDNRTCEESREDRPRAELRGAGRTAPYSNMPVPPPQATGGYYGVKINKVRNGFIVEIGCEAFVSQSWEEVAGALRIYWENPKKA